MKKRIMIFCDSYLPGTGGGDAMHSVFALADGFKNDFDFYIVTRDCDGETDGTPYVKIPRNIWSPRHEASVFYASPESIDPHTFKELFEDVAPDLVFLNSAFSLVCKTYLRARARYRLNHVPTAVNPNGECSPEKRRSTAKFFSFKWSQMAGLYDGLHWQAQGDLEKSDISALVRETGSIFIAPIVAEADSKEFERQDLDKADGPLRRIIDEILSTQSLPSAGPELGTKRRLWVISEIYYPEEISTGYYLTSIAEGLSEKFDVKVVCGQPNYAARGLRARKREFRRGTEIFRVWGTRFDKNVIPLRFLNMLTLSVATFLFGLRRFGRNDQILVVTAPPSLPYVSGLAAMFKGASYTLLLHDCYPEVMIAVGKMKANSFFTQAINLLNSLLYKHASKLIVVGRDMGELMHAKTSGFEIPIVFIPNWADLETIQPTPRQTNTLLSDLGLEDKFVFLYAGNIGYPTDIESIIECADRLKDRNEFHFVFIGSGAKAKYLRHEVERRRLTNISILGQRPRDEQIIFLNACDVGLISLVKNMWGTAMPSRTYNIIAAGKPILALTDDGSELARVIDEDEVGWYTPPGDADRLEKLMVEVFENRARLSEIGDRAREVAVRKYSLKNAIEKYSVEFGTAASSQN